MTRGKRVKHNNAANLRPSLSDCLFMVGGRRKTKVKQYKEVGQSGTEAGGADQTFHPLAEVKDRQERHCSHHIRNQKGPKSGRIKSHWKSEALLWLSRAEGHTCCRTGMFSAYLCGRARPPVKTQQRPTLVCWTGIMWMSTLREKNKSEILPGKGAWRTPVGTRWSGAGWSRSPGGFDTTARFLASATRTPPLWGTASQESRPSSSILVIRSVKEAGRACLKIRLLSPLLTGWTRCTLKTAGQWTVWSLEATNRAFHTFCQHVAYVNSRWPRVNTIVRPLDSTEP